MENNTNAVAVVQQNNAVEVISREKINTYLTTFGLISKLSKTEADQFINIAIAFQLNPFKREIYCIPYEGAGGRKLSTIVGYEVYIKRAERTGKLSGWSVTTEGSVKDNTLKAIVTIHRKDWTHPFVHEVLFSEYNQNNHIWKSKPVTMTKKVCIGTGFRLCFSDELGGMPYTSEELPSNMGHDAIEANVEPTPAPVRVVNVVNTAPSKPVEAPKPATTTIDLEAKAAEAKAKFNEGKPAPKVVVKTVTKTIENNFTDGLEIVSGQVVNLYPPKNPKGPTSVKILGADDYFKTFDTKLIKLLETAKADSSEVKIGYVVETKGGYTNNIIKTIDIIERAMPSPIEDEAPEHNEEAPW